MPQGIVTNHHSCTNVYAETCGIAQALCAVATTLVHAGLVVRPLVTRKLRMTATTSSPASPAAGSQRTAAAARVAPSRCRGRRRAARAV